ncbi:MAG: ADP-glyceromanno-heptose 6-epimerase [bacterium]|nr:ADP-glyceromanno-heptose 6-epimerase [bacterium]
MIIVTGGAGFIGSAFVWKLNQEGITDIIVVDEFEEHESWRNLVPLKYTEYIHKTDFIELIQENTEFASDCSAVIHMGACSATTETNMDYLYTNNTQYTLILADWCLQNDIRYLYASSAATYGEGENGFDDNHDTIESLRPINRYAYSKQLADLHFLRNGLLDHIVGLKFFNVFGPNEYHKGSMRSVACQAVPQIKEHGKLRLFKSDHPDYEDGGQKRDFVYIKDCVNIMYWLMTNPNVNGIYNVGTGQAKTWNDLANAVFHGMDITPKIEYFDMPDHLKKQYQYFTEAKMDKLTSVGCPIKMTSLEDACADYVSNYLDPERPLS